jgi:Na+/H+ antiporter NhaC
LGSWSFVPPLLAIGLALLFRQIVPALVAGVVAGAFIRFGEVSLAPLLRVLDHDLVGALADVDHLKIVLFTMLLGGMVGLIGRSGGAGGLVAAVSRRARTRRSAQLTGWGAGLLVFFDDYANTLIVGPSLRPLTDKLRISREKLAFIVDATAAPIASVALISTWIGYEVGLIGDALAQTHLAGTDAYGVFLASLPYRFYAWLMLLFVAGVAFVGRDIGPMRRAETRAIGGDVLRPGSQPLSRTDLIDADRVAPAGQALVLALAPIVTVAVVTFGSLWATGRRALADAGDPVGLSPAGEVVGSIEALGRVLGASSSFDALLYGAAGGVLVALVAAVGLRRLDMEQGRGAFVEGVRSMTLAVVILTLAWMIGGVCEELGTAEAAVAWIGGGLSPRLVPATVFLVSALVSFSTGSSWSTMAVLVPVALPLSSGLATTAGWGVAEASTLVYATTGSVLPGAVFGDHCSPLSDTTVMSSMAAGCDHVDHVRTQMPYALAVGAVSLLVGDLAVGFGLPVWLALLLGVALLAGLLLLLARPSATEPQRRS